MDAFTVFYGDDAAELTMFRDRLAGSYTFVYWGALLLNCVLPQLLWSARLRLNPPVIVMICLGVVVGMWLERYEIVVSSLHQTQLPSAWGHYQGTFWDWSTLLGTVGLFLSGILLSVRFLPIVSMHEMRSLLAERQRAGAADQAS